MEDEHINLSEHTGHSVGPDIHPVKSPREYAKFIGIIFAIFIFAVGLTLIRGWSFRLFLNDFMAIFFITFAGFKFIHIEPFALAYRTYDIVSKRFGFWPYMVPFIEAVFGFFYLLTDKSVGLYLLTMLYSGTAGYGVWKEVRRKSEFVCACLGTVIRLPLSTVTLVENFGMFGMAFLMLFL